ncbi:MAG: hypothetical protein ACI8V8_001163, partial [Chitinophagales bacterium]
LPAKKNTQIQFECSGYIIYFTHALYAAIKSNI